MRPPIRMMYLVVDDEESIHRIFLLADTLFIKQIPKKPWVEELMLAEPLWPLRRCRSVAKLNNHSYDLEWPCNPQECPENLSTLPSYEVSFILSVYQIIEKRVFLPSARRVRGLVTASVSVVFVG